MTPAVIGEVVLPLEGHVAAGEVTLVRLLAGVDLEVPPEVGAPAVDEEAADGAALVLAPVVVHVLVEVLEGVEGHVALDALHRPVLVLGLVKKFRFET